MAASPNLFRKTFSVLRLLRTEPSQFDQNIHNAINGTSLSEIQSELVRISAANNQPDVYEGIEIRGPFNPDGFKKLATKFSESFYTTFEQAVWKNDWNIIDPTFQKEVVIKNNSSGRIEPKTLATTPAPEVTEPNVVPPPQAETPKDTQPVIIAQHHPLAPDPIQQDEIVPRGTGQEGTAATNKIDRMRATQNPAQNQTQLPAPAQTHAAQNLSPSPPQPSPSHPTFTRREPVLGSQGSRFSLLRRKAGQVSGEVGRNVTNFSTPARTAVRRASTVGLSNFINGLPGIGSLFGGGGTAGGNAGNGAGAGNNGGSSSTSPGGVGSGNGGRGGNIGSRRGGGGPFNLFRGNNQGRSGGIPRGPRQLGRGFGGDERKAWLIRGLIILAFFLALFGMIAGWFGSTEKKSSGTTSDLVKIEKTGDEYVGGVNDVIHYSITVTYTGTTAANVQVTDPLPRNTQFISAGSGGQLIKDVVTWDLKGLVANQPTVLQLIVKPLTSDVWIQNTAEAKVLTAAAPPPTGSTSGSGTPTNPGSVAGVTDFVTLLSGQGRNVNVMGDENSFVATAIANGTSYVAGQEANLHKIYQVAAAKQINPLAILVLWGTETGFNAASGSPFSCPPHGGDGFDGQLRCAVNTYNNWMEHFESNKKDGKLALTPNCIYEDPFIFATEKYGPTCAAYDGNDYFLSNFVKFYKQFLGAN